MSHLERLYRCEGQEKAKNEKRRTQIPHLRCLKSILTNRKETANREERRVKNLILNLIQTSAYERADVCISVLGENEVWEDLGIETRSVWNFEKNVKNEMHLMGENNDVYF
jgi:hypothetical protein